MAGVECFWLEYATPMRWRAFDDDRNVIADEVDREWLDSHEWRTASAIMVAADGRRDTTGGFGPGAMWDLVSWPERGDAYEDSAGSDGRYLVVALPPDGQQWLVDGEAGGGGHWQRTGDPTDPPTLSVTPSILTPDYHGFLTNGVLVEV